MTTIKAHLKKTVDNSYSIIIEDGLLKKVPDLLKKKPVGTKHAIIADKNVGKLYGKKLMAQMARKGIQSSLITFPPGDRSKRLEIVENIANQMVQKKFDRCDAIIALGGGVSGDIGGFVASIYMRGIPYIHIPTSIVAMCDSSIGGKTGVNLEGGKNLLGRIEQPSAVLIDPSLLKTLPQEEYRIGMGEVLKYGAIMDSGLFKILEKSTKKIQKRDREILNKIIIRSCKDKVSVIEKDEHEGGLRKVLNYGHTTGHAIEKLSKYKISHGEAISIGMKIANTMAVHKKLLQLDDSKRINNLINAYNIIEPRNLSIIQPSNATKLWNLMQSDKKATNSQLQFILPTGIGQHTFSSDCTRQDFTLALKNYA